MNILFKSANNIQQMMFQTDSTRSVPHLWIFLRDLLLSITLYRVMGKFGGLHQHQLELHTVGYSCVQVQQAP